MDSEAMLKLIEERGQYRDRGQALESARAVLSVLGERLEGGAPGNLAAQLPPELAEALPTSGPGDAFGIEEFERRVAARETGRVSPAEAHSHAAAVLTTVLAAVSTGERRHIVSQLPSEYEDFLPE
jgi:uncharacterized protein (DUF2267 family)